MRKRVSEIHVELMDEDEIKEIVKKGQEFIEFDIKEYGKR